MNECLNQCSWIKRIINGIKVNKAIAVGIKIRQLVISFSISCLMNTIFTIIKSSISGISYSCHSLGIGNYWICLVLESNLPGYQINQLIQLINLTKSLADLVSCRQINDSNPY